MDSVGPGRLVRHMTDSVRHMQVCMLLHWGSDFIDIKVKTAKENAWLELYYTCICLLRTTVRTECCLAEINSEHVLVSAGISRLLDTRLFGIHNAYYIVNSILCAVILVCGGGAPAYRLRPMHGPIHILDIHGAGTKHIVHHSQKSGVQWSEVAEFASTLHIFRSSTW